MKKINNYIHGSITSSSDNFLPVYDPSKGEKINEVVLSNELDFENVISSSEKAFIEWSEVTPLKRSRIISKYKEILEKNIDLLA